MPATSFSVTDTRKSGTLIVGAGIAAIILILATAGIFLLHMPSTRGWNSSLLKTTG